MSENVILNRFNVLNSVGDEFLNEVKQLYIFKDNEQNSNVFISKNNGDVYAFGSNRNGVLGFGHTHNVEVPTINEELNLKQILDFRNSSHHVIARSIDGKIYCWGSNYQGRLGNGREDKKIYQPKLNNYLEAKKIIEICCGEAHSLALTSDGSVYSWGSNLFGQVGSVGPRNNLCEPIPIKVINSNSEKIIAISCGSRHSAALASNGSLYCWGDNRNGQLGIGSQYDSHRPVVIRFDQNICIKTISCGSKYSLSISNDDNIHVFGDNKFGQLGIGDRKNISRPQKLDYSKKFDHVAAHYQNDISVAISKENILYVWGKCGEENIIQPKETDYICAEQIFQTFVGITVRTIKYQYYLSQDFISNGRYRKNWFEDSKIGYGSFGETFRVKNMFTQEIFAIKKIPIKENNNSIKKLISSASILELKCENLVKYYNVWYENDFDLKMGFREYSEDSTLYIQMELCDKTLEEIQKEISENFKLQIADSLKVLGYFISSEIFIEILEGVNYLHQNNSMHRDLCPENIMIKFGSNNKFVKIVDFGLLKFIDNSDRHTSDVGHVRYQAPEATSNQYDTKADIYSLGSILRDLFEIFVNKPYENVLILKSKYASLKQLSIDMLNQDPGLRPSCEEILQKKNAWRLSMNEFDADLHPKTIPNLKTDLCVMPIIISKLSNL